MSQTDAQDKAIDGHTYRVLMLDPLVSARLFVDLTKIVGPSLASVGQILIQADDTKAAFKQLMDGGTSGSEIGKLLGDGLEKAIVGFIDRVEPHKLEEIISLMRGVTSVKVGDNWPELNEVFSMHFRGRIKAMYQWLAFAIRAQYRDF